jgi:hypothetical protein
LFHPGSHIPHGQDFNIPTISTAKQPVEDVVQNGKTIVRFGQVFGMQAEMKDSSVASGGFQSSAEAFNPGAQCDESGSRRPDRVKKQ